MPDPDRQALIDDLAALVRCPTIGGDEVAGLRLVASIAQRLGLQAELHEEDLTEIRSASGYPGEEVERATLHTLTVRRPGATGPRLAFCAHVDVVPVGRAAWSVPPFGAVIRDGRLYGRGAADMKSGLVAALHAMAAAQSPSAVLQVVAGEEDGGVGAFAALRRDADFAACVIPEPTDAAIVCATAGALTWTMRITGRAAHASRRRDGVSALDRYIPVHAALATFEDRLNATIDHPLMRRLELPYPLSVGRLSTGDWSSTVPDELVCEGRLGVPIGSDPAVLRAEFEAIVQAAADAAGPPPEVCWTGGQFAPAETSTDHPLVGVLQDAVTSVTGHPAPLTGVPYGTDMRQYVERGIPTVLYGPGSIDEAHATDESVPLTEVVTATRVLTRLVDTFGQLPTTSR